MSADVEARVAEVLAAQLTPDEQESVEWLTRVLNNGGLGGTLAEDEHLRTVLDALPRITAVLRPASEAGGARCTCDPGPEGQHRDWCDLENGYPASEGTVTSAGIRLSREPLPSPGEVVARSAYVPASSEAGGDGCALAEDGTCSACGAQVPASEAGGVTEALGAVDLDAAVARVEDSRQTHVLWRDYWLEYEAHRENCGAPTCPWEAAREAQEPIAGDLPRQVRMVEEYDNVLAALAELRALRAQPGSGS